MEIRVFDNTALLADAAAAIFADMIQKKPDCVLGLATGASPVPTYERLVTLCRAGKLSFRDVRTFNLDEYCDLPRADKNSYYTFMHAHLFDLVDIKEENVHLLDGNAADADAEAKRFDDAIQAAGGIDIQLLGIGTNGHIGFNEPADAFTDGTFQVRLSDSTVRSNSVYFDEAPMPRYALTMGVGAIMRAKRIVLLAAGPAKAEAIQKAVKGAVTPRCPASILQTHPDATLLLDRDAASLL